MIRYTNAEIQTIIVGAMSIVISSFLIVSDIIIALSDEKLIETKGMEKCLSLALDYTINLQFGLYGIILNCSILLSSIALIYGVHVKKVKFCTPWKILGCIVMCLTLFLGILSIVKISIAENCQIKFLILTLFVFLSLIFYGSLMYGIYVVHSKKAFQMIRNNETRRELGNCFVNDGIIYDVNEEIYKSLTDNQFLQEHEYVILKKLGEGAFSTVYLVQKKTKKNDSESPIKLACKIINTKNATKETVDKFLPRELDILKKLQHPYLMSINNIFEKDAKYYIFMRFAENGNLCDYNFKHGPVNERHSRIWFRQLALGLQYLHELDIAHRDIKCENILINEHFNLLITDYGFSRYTVDASGKNIMSNTYCGTLMYAPPEILNGSAYNPKIADCWSLGIVLYILITKLKPFDETNIKKLYELQINCKWKFEKNINNSLSNQVKKLVTNMLLPDCNKRWKIDQIVNCEWISMDPDLLIMTNIEQAALNDAIQKRKEKNYNFNNKTTIFHDDVTAEHSSMNEREIPEVTIINNDCVSYNVSPSRYETNELISIHSKNITSTIP